MTAMSNATIGITSGISWYTILRQRHEAFVCLHASSFCCSLTK